MVYTVLTILIVLASILLIGVVLVQKSKGGGLSENFNAGNDMFGVQTTTDIVEKITWGLIAFIVVLCIITTAFVPKQMSDGSQRSVIENTTVTPQRAQQPNMEGQPVQQAPVATPAEAPAN